MSAQAEFSVALGGLASPTACSSAVSTGVTGRTDAGPALTGVTGDADAGPALTSVTGDADAEPTLTGVTGCAQTPSLSLQRLRAARRSCRLNRQNHGLCSPPGPTPSEKAVMRRTKQRSAAGTAGRKARPLTMDVPVSKVGSFGTSRSELRGLRPLP